MIGLVARHPARIVLIMLLSSFHRGSSHFWIPIMLNSWSWFVIWNDGCCWLGSCRWHPHTDLPIGLSSELSAWSNGSALGRLSSHYWRSSQPSSWPSAWHLVHHRSFHSPCHRLLRPYSIGMPFADSSLSTATAAPTTWPGHCWIHSSRFSYSEAVDGGSSATAHICWHGRHFGT